MASDAPSSFAPERQRVALVIGTRPEAIKMAPVHRALCASKTLRPTLISSGQHRELLRSTLSSMELQADYDLDLMAPGQTPNDVSRCVFQHMPDLLRRLAPSAVLVQGDTTTVLATSIAAYNLGLPVGHVEAGLRTYDHDNPFPEEGNRQLVDRLASWCFAPTQIAADNLAAERIAPERIHVTGNPIVDALCWALPRSTYRCPSPTVVLTLHRRESFGDALEEILLGVRDFVEATPDARVLWPVHPNPNVVAAAGKAFADHPRLQRVRPLPYVDLVGALASCRVIVTDSGGIQEEAPSLGKTVLVAREKTARVEALDARRNRLVGRSRHAIRNALGRAWEEPEHTGALPASNPYGDGHAGERIANILERALSSGL